MAAIEFTDLQKDAIAEVMNISMGNAATAASELLNAKVWITTPRVSVQKAAELRKESLEPAVCVKIVYVKGISGTNMMILRQDDVQLILNQLMGQPLEVTPDFEFDELNISAVSEVMNQMMGSSATALSNFLGMHVDISVPTPYIMNEIKLSEVHDYDTDEEVIAITFDLTIEGVIKSEFVSVMCADLAQIICDKMLNPEPEPEPEPPPAPAAQPQSGTPAPAPAAHAPPPQAGHPHQPYPQQAPPGYGVPPQGIPPSGYGAYPPPGLPPPGYGAYPPMGMPMGGSPVNIQNAQLHQFEIPQFNLQSDQGENLQLLMGVPLQISVEIGTAKRKVKDILDFTQGTIIELERQAGAPVDVVVNGNLIARGDVVVIDDNFAVRITEILKSKFMDSLGKE
ncbi:MAG: flagellar motor switch phosphatase FliY [Oscillospiraceae bacterium]|nr:flagellar motor switch phosphatase FliY [Oscillospiraceae bacterium]